MGAEEGAGHGWREMGSVMAVASWQCRGGEEMAGEEEGRRDKQGMAWSNAKVELRLERGCLASALLVMLSKLGHLKSVGPCKSIPHDQANNRLALDNRM